MEIYLTSHQSIIYRLISDIALTEGNIVRLKEFLEGDLFSNDPFLFFTDSWSPLHDLRSTSCLKVILQRLHELGVLKRAMQHTCYAPHPNGSNDEYKITALHNVVKNRGIYVIQVFTDYEECWEAANALSTDGMTPISMCIYYCDQLQRNSYDTYSIIPLLKHLLSDENPRLRECLDAQTPEGENCIDRELKRASKLLITMGFDPYIWEREIVEEARARLPALE